MDELSTFTRFMIGVGAVGGFTLFLGVMCVIAGIVDRKEDE